MDASGAGERRRRDTLDAAAPDSRPWMRDMGALLALPAMWVDHRPEEIASGLLSVLFGVLQLDAAYVRFDAPRDGEPQEVWRPAGPRAAPELRLVLEEDPAHPPGVTARDVQRGELGTVRVASLPLALPWETGLVLVSAGRSDFPTDRETHLLRVAVGQAAIAIHTARRLARAHAALATAEATVRRQSELLRSLAEEVEPLLVSSARRLRDASRFGAEVDGAADVDPPEPRRPVRTLPRGGPESGELHVPLTRRETEVLGLLAQGLSNKEIAGVMWLSDRTVERHITGLYRKIGVVRRSEATAYAFRHDVV